MKYPFHSAIYVFILCLLFIACNQNDQSPPQVTITSPAVGSAVSGTISVQISATDDTQVANVKLYVRSPKSESTGRLINTAIQAPFVISLNTLDLPNLSQVEIYAVATDISSKKAQSTPSTIIIQNPGVPSLRSFTSYIYPKRSTVSTTIHAMSLEDIQYSLSTDFLIDTIMPPNCFPDCQTSEKEYSPVNLQSLKEFNTSLQWEITCNPSLNGYYLYQSTIDLVGPYTEPIKRGIPNNCTTFRYSIRADNVDQGDIIYGLAKGVSNGGALLSGSSNVDKTQFIGISTITSPEEDTTVTNGRPNLAWNETPNADGYFYAIYDKSPFASDKKVIWGNFPRAIAETKVDYPKDRVSLPSGTYYWWVIGTRFDEQRKADAFSYSMVRRFVVP